MKVNLIVIKTSKPENLKAQYEALGLAFEYHRHGKGPYHFSASISGLTFEIYPLPKSYEVADSTTRLGIQVNDLANTLIKLLTQVGKLSQRLIIPNGA